jgi:hypothetical protein
MRLHLRPLGVRQHESFHPKLESQPSFRWNLEGSVRSRSRNGAARTCARPHRSRIERSRGLFGAMGIVATACWRDCSDDSRTTAAKRCFGEEALADRVLNARSRSGLVVGQLWSRYCGSRSA